MATPILKTTLASHMKEDAGVKRGGEDVLARPIIFGIGGISTKRCRNPLVTPPPNTMASHY